MTFSSATAGRATSPPPGITTAAAPRQIAPPAHIERAWAYGFQGDGGLPQIQVARERDPDLPIAPIRRVADLS